MISIRTGLTHKECTQLGSACIHFHVEFGQPMVTSIGMMTPLAMAGHYDVHKTSIRIF